MKKISILIICLFLVAGCTMDKRQAFKKTEGGARVYEADTEELEFGVIEEKVVMKEANAPSAQNPYQTAKENLSSQIDSLTEKLKKINDYINEPLNISKLKNGNNKYTGKLETKIQSIEYEVDFSPDKWQIKKTSDFLDVLQNKQDVECIVFLNELRADDYRNNPRYEKVNNLISVRSYNEDYSTYFYINEGITLSLYLDKESEHQNCISEFQQIAPSFKVNKIQKRKQEEETFFFRSTLYWEDASDYKKLIERSIGYNQAILSNYEEHLKNPVSIQKMDNGNYKYIGDNSFHEYDDITFYSVEYDPEKWEVKLSEWTSQIEPKLANRIDPKCDITLAASPKGFEVVDVNEELEDGIMRVGWGKSIYYYTSTYDGEHSVTIESYLEDESAHPNCLDNFREIAKTLKIEK